MMRSYSEITLTRSRNTALTASCHDQIDRGKYDNGRKSALRTSAWQDSRPGVTASSAAAGWDYSESRSGPSWRRALCQGFSETQYVDAGVIDASCKGNMIVAGGD